MDLEGVAQSLPNMLASLGVGAGAAVAGAGAVGSRRAYVCDGRNY